METIFREARKEDIPEILTVFGESITDMFQRHNLPPPGPVNPYRVAIHTHILETGIFHVAQQGERLVAFACAIVRGHNWFLAGFWAKPEVQGGGIGITLLRRTWEASRQAGARTWFVWASSDPPALASYMKMGMLPGCQLMAFQGEPRPGMSVPAAYTTRPLEVAQAMRLDRTVRGARRERDHDFWSRAGWQAEQVLNGGEVVGYYYRHDGSIGPAAWAHSRHAEAVLALACRGQAKVSIEVPGMNHDALRFALQSGLRLTGHSHLLMTHPFGRLERYLPSDAYLF